MHTALRLPFAIATVLAVAACSSATPGWTYAPAPPSTPIPSIAASVEPSGAASGAPSDEVSPPPASASPSVASGVPSSAAGSAVKVSASSIKFDQPTAEVPADVAFQVEFANNDAGIPHNVAVREGSATGAEKYKGEIFNGVATKVYDVPALPAGPYAFVCTVHPNMVIEVTAK